MSYMSAIEARRRAKGLTRRELAEAAGVSIRQITRYETGEQSPTLRVAVRLAGALGAAIDELVDEAVA